MMPFRAPNTDPRLSRQPQPQTVPDPWDKVGGILNEMEDQRTPLNVDPRTGRPFDTGSPFYSGPGLPPEGPPQRSPLSVPGDDPRVPYPFAPVGMPEGYGPELTNPNPIAEIPMDYGDIPIGTPPTPPLPMPPQFPSGGPLSPMELGYLEAPETPSLEEQTFGNDPFSLVDFPQAPAPQTPPLPGNPFAGRGPASPQTPKLPNPFGGRGGR